MREITHSEAVAAIHAHGWRGLPCSTLDETYYFDGPEEPTAADIFGDKQPKRPWRLLHKWAGYGPEKFFLSETETK